MTLDASFFNDQETVLVRLPTLGKFYPDGHPLQNQEMVEINFPTTKTQSILVNKSYLKENLTSVKLVQSLLVNKQIKATTLKTPDLDHILLKARELMFGPMYKPLVTCPVCRDRKEIEIDTSKMEYEIDFEKIKQKGIKIVRDEGLQEVVFETKTPQKDLFVRYRLLTAQDHLNIVKHKSKAKKHKLPFNEIEEQLRTLIVSVKTEDDQVMPVNVFVQHAPAIETNHINLSYVTVLEGVGLTFDFECEECFTREENKTVPLTHDFFRPKL